ncbi:MAG: type II toxin-antitoxin system RelE/ParE family toxin [Patescibacteria group bacterium]
MKAIFTEPFLDKFKELPKNTKQKFKKQLGFLLNNIRHPSLRAKKYDEERDIWQCRVNDNFRFYFLIKGDTYFILNIIKHPK